MKVPGGKPCRVDDLTPDPENRRKRTARSRDMIVDSLKRVGAARSIVINQAGKVLAGNGVVDAALEAGIEHLKIVDAKPGELIAVRVTGLTEAQERELAIFDNRTAELSEWDVEQLERDQAAGLDMSAFWTAPELGALLDVQAGGGLTDPDDVPGPRETTVEVGQVFALGAHRLICGDATDAAVIGRLFGAGEQADLVVTSPPYNVGLKYREYVDRSARDEYLAFIEGTARAFLPHLAPGRFVAWNTGVSPRTFPAHQVVRLEGVGLAFYRQIVWAKSGIPYPTFPATMRTARARHFHPNFTHEVIEVFEKTDAAAEESLGFVTCALCAGGGTMAARELAVGEAHEAIQLLAYGKTELGDATVPDKRYQNDVWRIAQSQATVALRTVRMRSSGLEHGGKQAHAEKEHPAAFPVEVPRAIATFLTAPGERVLDPFMGSGSTIIACEQLGRSGRGVELDPVYCQIIIDRWQAFTGQQAERVG